MVVELTEEEFSQKVFDLSEKKIVATKPTVVDFYASTCGPCRTFAKVFDQFSENFTDYDFYKVCVDDADDIMMEFKLRSMPTVLKVKDGETVTFPAIHKPEELHAILTDENI